MIPPRELAAQLAGSIFNYVERERTMVRHSIEEVLHDALLLAEIKGPHSDNDLADKLERLITLLNKRPDMMFGAPPDLYAALDALRYAYQEARKP